MSSLPISCPNCGSPNDPGVEHCYLCKHPLSGKASSKSVPRPAIPPSRLSRRILLWGVATGAVALATGGYLAYREYLAHRRLTDPHILTYAKSDGAVDAAWSPDGMRVASVSEDDGGAVQIWNATTGKKLATYTLELPVQGRFPVPLLDESDPGGTRVVWFADGKHVLAFVGSEEKQMVQVWNAASGARVHSFPVTQPLTLAVNEGNQPKMTAWALNERYLAVAKTVLLPQRKTFVEVWDIAAGSTISTLEIHGPDSGVPFGRVSGVDSMVWVPNGKKLALCYSTEKGVIYEIWDAPAGKRMPAFRVVVASLHTMAWLPNGTFLAVGTVIWDGETGRRVAASTVEGAAQAWSPDGKHLAVYSVTRRGFFPLLYGTISIIDASSGRQIAQYDEGEVGIGGRNMAWSPNGKDLLVLNGQIVLWKME